MRGGSLLPLEKTGYVAVSSHGVVTKEVCSIGDAQIVLKQASKKSIRTCSGGLVLQESEEVVVV